ncbi:MAG: hypothetical protein WC505_03055 [Patescibacteria group bacterium]
MLHQSWIAGEIADTGTIPIQNPMTGNFDILSLSPLFQILGAQLSLLTGIHEIYIYVALNFLLIPMLCLGFYLVTRKLFLNETIALLAVLIFFSLNSATYISRHISFFVIKEATIAIFLVFCILYLTITLLKHQGRYQVRLLALYGTLVAVTALTHQFTTFSIVSILVSLYVLLFVLYPQLRKKILLLGSIVFVAIIIVFLLNANLLFYPETGYLTTQQHTFTKDFTESSAVSSNDLRSSYLSSVFDDAYHPLLLLCAVFGGIFFIIVQKKSAREMPAHLFIPAVWIITFFILALQPIGNFQLLPTRFLHWTIIPLAIIAGYGLYFLLLSFKRSSIQLSLLAALVIIPLTMSITLNADSFDSTENISFKELESYVRIHTILADSDNKTVVSDPFFGYKLITISGAQLTYRYERTGMYRDDSLEFDAVKKFIYSDPESAYDYASSSGAKYIAINYDDKHRYYEEADYAKLDDADRYRRIVHEYPGSMDEISIYEIVPRNKDSLR